jgi:hypothetical protein
MPHADLIKQKEKQKEYARQWYLKNKEKRIEQSKQYNLKNKEKIKKYHEEYHKKWYLNNKEKRNEYNKQLYLKNKEKYKKRANNYQKQRRKVDIEFKILLNLRTRIYHALKGKYQKSKKTKNLLGCSVKKLWQHLKKHFKPGMTKENYGLWHIDHIRPCASFDLSNPKQQKTCFHYTNLQPLWAIDNIKKGAKIN